ncbi:acetaldehyde dehydrogenase (acetylating) [Abyssibius alkaniclasticus]|uniref:acetaldehyde dehydrogenase (acetylating) n=1 Tax=Abyssibius alkaniclasticus TaxID=2881234 RepID=UPI0023647749|nr:acetaldehyde dehydrogenase (acetylating) [Abyssibius alkaniclasticus]UPH72244.1 acetaldehyde dehydrogenase (acetylating) [Abyssibius alkaniclasticus]
MATKAAIIGSGHIGTDLMVKILRKSQTLELAAMVGIDPASEGLAFARRQGVAAIDTGVAGLRNHPDFADIGVVFDATSAAAHRHNLEALSDSRAVMVDLTPAAIGPYVVPPVNLARHAGAKVVNMVTCGGQATIPIVRAVSRVAKVAYAEIVASIASKSAGPGTRANIDEFTTTTARAIEQVGGAERGKAIIILNPAEPPLIMRDTVICLCAEAAPEAIVTSVEAMVAEVQTYVPGYRLKQAVQVESVPSGLWPGAPAGMKVSVFLEVEGAGHHLPTYAGNLDIMTSAALRTGEFLVTGALEAAQ